jgi:hypothetical protein
MPYTYIERYYGTKFVAGMRVKFTEYDDKPGKVRRVNGDPAHVSVRFDDGTTGYCHPDSLKIEAPA